MVTSSGQLLQVKTHTKGRRPGVIRSFGYDVITVEIDPATATVVRARRYIAADLYAEFRAKWESNYRHINDSFAAWGRRPHRPLRPRLDHRVWRPVRRCHEPVRAVAETCSGRSPLGSGSGRARGPTRYQHVSDPLGAR